MNKFITDSNIFLSYGDELLTWNDPEYYVHTYVSGSGSFEATPTAGCSDDLCVLDYTASRFWNFSGYKITGATLTGNLFKFQNSDVDVTAVFTAIPASGYDTIGCGTFKTGRIGDQIWMLQDLACPFDFLTTASSNTQASYIVNGGWVPGVGNLYVYPNDGTISFERYASLYNQPAVQALNVRKDTLIPGWHVPTVADWQQLIDYVGGPISAAVTLKSTGDWLEHPTGDYPNAITSNDAYGFNLEPRQWDGAHGGTQNKARYWCSDLNYMYTYGPYHAAIYAGDTANEFLGYKIPNYAPIRLVKDV